jgi:hypothetical protein
MNAKNLFHRQGTEGSDMKKFLLVFFICMISVNILAFQQDNTAKNVKIALKFNYEVHDKNKIARQAEASTTLKMSVNQKNEWQFLGGAHSRDSIEPSNVSRQTQISDLLSFVKVEEVTVNTAKIKFMIIDLKSGLGYIREPTMVVKYGQKSHLTIEDGNRRLRLALVITKND